MTRVTITRTFCGLIHMQVCTVPDATDEEILDVCNRENPSGTTWGWTRVVREGEGEPVPCGDDAGRVHVLVSC